LVALIGISEIFMQKWIKVLLSALLVTSIVGCSSKGGVDENADADAKANARNRSGKYGKYGAGGANGGSGAGGRYGSGSGRQDAGPTGGVLSERVIYFGFDSEEVLPEYQNIVSAHAEWLAAHPDSNLVLEGHGDERGSSEYNVALGERRGLSVSRSMRLQGVSDAQLRVLSYGEEKPATSGHDEGSWQQNRRVELFYPPH
jgi:peptidoglycan-associated lipoprotein